MKNLSVPSSCTLYFALIALISCQKEYSCEGDGCPINQSPVTITYRDSLTGNGWDSESFVLPVYVCQRMIINLYISEQVDIQGTTTMLGRQDDIGFNGNVIKPSHEFINPTSGLLMNRVQVYSDTIYNPTDNIYDLYYKSNNYWRGDGLLKIVDTTFLNVEYFK